MVLDAWNRRPGVRLWRNHTGMSKMTRTGAFASFGVGGPGGADLLGICNGHFLAIEVKRRAGKLTDNQRFFLSEVEENGGMALVATQTRDGDIVEVTPEDFEARNF